MIRKLFQVNIEFFMGNNGWAKLLDEYFFKNLTDRLIFCFIVETCHFDANFVDIVFSSLFLDHFKHSFSLLLSRKQEIIWSEELCRID